MAYGISNDTEAVDFRNKDVVVVGMGAFAIENAVHAVNSGARRVTLLVRNRRFIFFFRLQSINHYMYLDCC